MHHSFIGQFGKKYRSIDTGFITNDWDTLCAFKLENLSAFSFTHLNGLYFCKQTDKIRLKTDHIGIHTHILSYSHIMLYKTIMTFYNPLKSKLLCYKTDCIYIRNPNIINPIDYKPQKMPVKYEYDYEKTEQWEDEQKKRRILKINHPTLKHVDKKPIEMKVEFGYVPLCSEFEPDSRDHTIQTTNWNVIDINKEKDYHLKSFCMDAPPGAGKTTILKNNFKNLKTIYKIDNMLVMCYTNKACNNIIISFKEIKEEINCCTLDSKFYKQKKNQAQPLDWKNIKVIQIDEYSMIPLKFMGYLYKLKLSNPELIIQCYGDRNQCGPTDFCYNVFSKKVFRFICGNNLINKEFVPNFGRFKMDIFDDNMTTFDHIQYLIKHKQFHPSLKDKKIKDDLLVNICKFNNSRWTINARCHTQLYGKNDKNFLKVGLKVISNYSDDVVNRSQFYYVIDIKDNFYTISNTLNGKPLKTPTGELYWCSKFTKDNKYISNKQKKKMDEKEKFSMDPGYASTVYKWQGTTIEEEFNIYDLNGMNINEIYTSVGRCRSILDVYFNYTDKIFKEQVETFNIEASIKKIKKGEIYELHNAKDNLYYVGETKKSTLERFKEHCKYTDDPIQKTDYKNWKCKRLIYHYYFNKQELRNIEANYIQYYLDQKKTLVNTLKLPKDHFIKYNVKEDEAENTLNEMIHPNIREKYHINVCSNGVVMIKWTDPISHKNLKKEIRSQKIGMDNAIKKAEEIKQQLIEEDNKKFKICF